MLLSLAKLVLQRVHRLRDVIKHSDGFEGVQSEKVRVQIEVHHAFEAFISDVFYLFLLSTRPAAIVASLLSNVLAEELDDFLRLTLTSPARLIHIDEVLE